MLEWLFGKGGSNAKVHVREEREGVSKKRRRVEEDDDDHNDAAKHEPAVAVNVVQDYEAEIEALLQELREREELIERLRREVSRLGGDPAAVEGDDDDDDDDANGDVEREDEVQGGDRARKAADDGKNGAADAPSTPLSARAEAVARLMEEQPLERLADEYDRQRNSGDGSQTTPRAPSLADTYATSSSPGGPSETAPSLGLGDFRAAPAATKTSDDSSAAKPDTVPVPKLSTETQKSPVSASAVDIAEGSESPTWEEEPPVLNSLKP